MICSDGNMHRGSGGSEPEMIKSRSLNPVDPLMLQVKIAIAHVFEEGEVGEGVCNRLHLQTRNY